MSVHLTDGDFGALHISSGGQTGGQIAGVELVPKTEFTVPHTKPVIVNGKISKRQLDKLPNFQCHCLVYHLKILYAGKLDGGVVFWKNVELPRGGRNERYEILGTHNGPVTCLLWHTYHNLLFSAAADSTVKTWHVLPGGKHTCVQTILAHDATVTGMGQHCNVLITISSDNTLKMWKADDTREGLLYPWFVLKQIFAFDSWVTCIHTNIKKAAEDTHGEIYVGDGNGGLTIFRSITELWASDDVVFIDTLELVRHIKGFRKLGITKVLPVHSASLLLTLSWDNLVRFSDMFSYQTLHSLENERSGTRFLDIAWNHETEELLATDDTGHLTVWSTTANKVVTQLHAGALLIHLTFTETQFPSEYCIVSSREYVLAAKLTRMAPYHENTGHGGRVVGMHVAKNYTIPQHIARHHFDQDELHVISGGVDNSLLFWRMPDDDIDSNVIILHKQVTIPGAEVSSLQYVQLPNDNVVVTGHDDGILRMWSLYSDNVTILKGHKNTIASLAVAQHRFRPGKLNATMLGTGRTHIVSASYDGNLGVFNIHRDDFQQPRCEAIFQVSDCELHCVLYDDMRNQYVCGGNEALITCWHVGTHKLLAALCNPNSKSNKRYSHAGAVTSMVVDGNLLYSGGEDSLVNMWNLVDNTLLRTYQLHEAEITNLMVITQADGIMASCDRDGLLLLWKQDGDILHSFAAKRECYSLQSRQPNLRHPSLIEMFVGMDDGCILTVLFDLDTPNANLSAPTFADVIGLPDPIDPDMDTPHDILASLKLGVHPLHNAINNNQQADPQGSCISVTDDASYSVANSTLPGGGTTDTLRAMYVEQKQLEQRLNKIDLSQLLAPISPSNDIDAVDELLKVPPTSSSTPEGSGPQLTDIDVQLPSLTPRGRNNLITDLTPPVMTTPIVFGTPTPLHSGRATAANRKLSVSGTHQRPKSGKSKVQRETTPSHPWWKDFNLPNRSNIALCQQWTHPAQEQQQEQRTTPRSPTTQGRETQTLQGIAESTSKGLDQYTRLGFFLPLAKKSPL